ncbi:piggyBac transposable element-derived protein 3-like [Rhagoletis pomonella]|uniref:piggyBac transposable element-derived protein 3-like n=1 Tax=Rhagoletis pomonella TaxID=28610 RepID=UPI0017806AC8|nr:piggyBac transposable element-derived protein 3-like [Rhagoletis pomonella]
MFIKSKPIRFGYKYWCLTSDDGYCYQFILYAGAATKFSNDYSLGENVVLQLLSHLERPENHNVTFDNFFTSYKLMRRLSCNGYFATGTVRDNRTNYAPLVCINDMKKRSRGSSDFVFDSNNKVLVTRWNDNSVVTIMSNFLKHEPLRHVKRYDRKGKKMITVPQPLLIHEYNHRMGGVDLFDNAMNNYRIKIRGKKWYWPLLTNAFDAAMVNAWKLKVFCAKYEKFKPMNQFDFRVEVAEALVTDVRTCKRRITNRDGGQRTDGLNHIVETLDRRARCRQCGIKTQFGCIGVSQLQVLT